MKKAMIGATVLGVSTAVVAVRRFGPDLAQRGMQKCHEMMAGMAQQDSSEPSAQFTEDSAQGQEDGSQGEKKPQTRSAS